MKKITILLACFLTACQAPSVQSGQVAPAAQPAPVARPPSAPAAPGAADLLVQLRAMTADNGCSTQSQCRTVAVGARPCGGPEGFIAYSIATADRSAAVEEKAAQLTRARVAELNRLGGVASVCTVVTDPGAVCVAGRCQLGKGSLDPR